MGNTSARSIAVGHRPVGGDELGPGAILGRDARDDVQHLFADRGEQRALALLLEAERGGADREVLDAGAEDDREEIAHPIGEALVVEQLVDQRVDLGQGRLRARPRPAASSAEVERTPRRSSESA